MRPSVFNISQFFFYPRHANDEEVLIHNKHKWIQLFYSMFGMLVFTYRVLSSVRFANTAAGRNVIAFEDKFLFKCTMEYVKR